MTDRVTLAHGGGGRAMRALIDDIFVAAFGAPEGGLEDQARLVPPPGLAQGGRLAFTTDGFVVDPLEFPGGDIGRLAVWGTVNDLAVGGATPLWLSCAMIIEEGLEISALTRAAQSMAAAAREAGVRIVTGDTKVVGRGQADKLFITTAGVGVIAPGVDLAARLVRPGDVAIVNGGLGAHGATILNARGDMQLQTPAVSDCAPLNRVMAAAMTAAPGLRCARDCTRGGLAAALNEIAEAAGCAIEIEEERLDIAPEVRGFCEILGLDPLYLANEGRLVCFAPEDQAEAALAAIRATPEGAGAAIIGRAQAGVAGRVTMKGPFGGARLVDMLVGEQLPRIC